MNFKLLLKDLEEVKSVIYEDTERAEELLDHIISEVAIKSVQQSFAPDSLKAVVNSLPKSLKTGKPLLAKSG